MRIVSSLEPHRKRVTDKLDEVQKRVTEPGADLKHKTYNARLLERSVLKL